MSIYLKYFEGLIEEEVLNTITIALAEKNIALEPQDMTEVTTASIEELVAPVALYLSSDVVQAYFLGLTANAGYDVLKTTVVKLWQQISGKKYFRYSPNKTEELEANFDLNIKTPDNISVQFKLKGNVSDEIKEKCVEKAFTLLEKKAFEKNGAGYICRLDEVESSWEVYNQQEYIHKYIIPKKR